MVEYTYLDIADGKAIQCGRCQCIIMVVSFRKAYHKANRKAVACCHTKDCKHYIHNHHDQWFARIIGLVIKTRDATHHIISLTRAEEDDVDSGIKPTHGDQIILWSSARLEDPKQVMVIDDVLRRAKASPNPVGIINNIVPWFARKPRMGKDQHNADGSRWEQRQEECSALHGTIYGDSM